MRLYSLLIASCMLTCSLGPKHMPNRLLYIIMWSDKWPNTLTSVRKLANVVGNWPVADCYFELCNKLLVSLMESRVSPGVLRHRKEATKNQERFHMN